MSEDERVIELIESLNKTSIFKYDNLYNKFIKGKLICKDGEIEVSPEYSQFSIKEIYDPLRIFLGESNHNLNDGMIEYFESKIRTKENIIYNFSAVNVKKINKSFDYIIKGTPIVKGMLGMIQGSSSAQKSLFIQSLLCTLHNDVEHPLFRGEVCNGPKVLYFDYEQGPVATINRLEQLSRGFNLDVESICPFFSDSSSDGMLPKFVKSNGGKIIKLINQYSANLIVIDTFAAGCGVKDENDAVACQEVLDFLKGIARITNCCIIVVHHKSKDGANSINSSRGSVSIPAAMDFIIDIEATVKDGFYLPVRTLRVIKDRNRLYRGQDKVKFQFVGGENSNKDEMCTLLVVGESEVEEKDLSQVIIEYIGDKKISSKEIVDGIKRNKSNVLNMLNKLVDDKVLIKNREGKFIYYALNGGLKK